MSMHVLPQSDSRNCTCMFLLRYLSNCTSSQSNCRLPGSSLSPYSHPPTATGIKNQSRHEMLWESTQQPPPAIRVGSRRTDARKRPPTREGWKRVMRCGVRTGARGHTSYGSSPDRNGTSPGRQAKDDIRCEGRVIEVPGPGLMLMRVKKASYR